MQSYNLYHYVNLQSLQHVILDIKNTEDCQLQYQNHFYRHHD